METLFISFGNNPNHFILKTLITINVGITKNINVNITAVFFGRRHRQMIMCRHKQIKKIKKPESKIK